MFFTAVSSAFTLQQYTLITMASTDTSTEQEGRIFRQGSIGPSWIQATKFQCRQQASCPNFEGGGGASCLQNCPSTSCVSYFHLGLDNRNIHNQNIAISDRYYQVVALYQFHNMSSDSFVNTRSRQFSLWPKLIELPALNVVRGSCPSKRILTSRQMMIHDWTSPYISSWHSVR